MPGQQHSQPTRISSDILLPSLLINQGFSLDGCSDVVCVRDSVCEREGERDSGRRGSVGCNDVMFLWNVSRRRVSV